MPLHFIRNDIHESIYFTGSYSRISSVKRYIQRTFTNTDDCIGLFFQKFRVSGLSDNNLVSDRIFLA